MKANPSYKMLYAAYKTISKYIIIYSKNNNSLMIPLYLHENFDEHFLNLGGLIRGVWSYL